MTETTVAIIFAAAAPTIVALATFMGQMKINAKQDENSSKQGEIHKLVNSSHDELKKDNEVLKTEVTELKKEITGLKRELRISGKRVDRLEQEDAPAAERPTGAAGSEPTPT